MKNGFLQALGIAIYISLVGTLMWNANHVFGPHDTFLTPILVLTLFATSALVCSLIVFYKPYKLFTSGKKKEALDTVIYTTVFLFVFLLIFLGATFLIR